LVGSLLHPKLDIYPREKIIAGFFEQFFTGFAIENLLGEGTKPKHLSDFRFEEVLDKLYDRGLSEIYLSISLRTA
jgi:hypothetical protein